MEMLIAGLVTVLTQVFKWLAEKMDYEKAKTTTLIFAFICSLVGVFAWKRYEGALDWSNYENIVSVFGVAVAYYEVVVKRIINPILDGGVSK